MASFYLYSKEFVFCFVLYKSWSCVLFFRYVWVSQGGAGLSPGAAGRASENAPARGASRPRSEGEGNQESVIYLLIEKLNKEGATSAI